MEHTVNRPRIIHILHDEAAEIKYSAFGRVGKIFSGEGIEAVWVKKEAEEIDPDWFSQAMVDLLIVLKGKLRFEFERMEFESCTLEPGEMIILPANTRCRAYRWPREEKGATVFLAVYPLR